ncbi:MAG: hypothetical protein WBE27_01835, partial [Microgenomates group bacterium]
PKNGRVYSDRVICWWRLFLSLLFPKKKLPEGIGKLGRPGIAAEKGDRCVGAVVLLFPRRYSF